MSIVPFGFVALLSIGLQTVSLCLLGYGIKNARYRVKKLVLIEAGITNSIFFFTFLGLTLGLFPLISSNSPLLFI